jgi:hypothetical protein
VVSGSAETMLGLWCAVAPRWVASLPKCAIAPSRSTGITAYLENGGTLEKARQMAAHASSRTTQLYERREDPRHAR